MVGFVHGPPLLRILNHGVLELITLLSYRQSVEIILVSPSNEVAVVPLEMVACGYSQVLLETSLR